MKRLAVAVLSIALLGGAAAQSFADVAADREALMKEIGRTMKSLSEIAKGATPFDAATVKAGGETISANLTKFGTLFDAGTEGASKQARPEIWSDRAGFDAAREEAIKAATALAAADEAGLKAALGAMGGTCKTCHQKYRLAD